MANAKVEAVKLKLVLDGGEQNGKQVKVNKTYNCFTTAASDDKIYQVGKVITGLQDKATLSIRKIEEKALTE